MSSLAWIDFDEAERQRAQRIMALFQERETRDELGLGAIRDSIADHLFPGTSTIQTRLRYMLFIPWLYRALEKRDVPEAQLRAEARDTENPACRRPESRRRIQRHHRPRCGTAAPAAAEFRLLGRPGRMGHPGLSRLARQSVRRLAGPRPFARRSGMAKTPWPAPRRPPSGIRPCRRCPATCSSAPSSA
jgi:hypothetical protein